MTDVLSREQIEALCSFLIEDLHAAWVDRVYALRDMALSALDNAEDAERYRWLCENANLSLGGIRGNCIIELDRYALMKTNCVELDAAIDAAIKEQKR